MCSGSLRVVSNYFYVGLKNNNSNTTTTTTTTNNNNNNNNNNNYTKKISVYSRSQKPS